MHIRKAVITAAGLGTRLLPMSKELPKEMLPVFSAGKNGMTLKPLLQALFEQLCVCGLAEFCFIVGRGKRAIEDHFTPDYDFLAYLQTSGKPELHEEMKSFYERVEKSSIIWINQPFPKGFGDAVLLAKDFVGDDDFLVAAGDTFVSSRENDLVKRLMQLHHSTDDSASLVVLEVEDPRKYGVVEVTDDSGHLKVVSAVEKPEAPRSNLAVVPLYVFKPMIFSELKAIRPGLHGELQLTDAIQRLIELGTNVHAVKLRQDETRFDIGTPQTYWEAIRSSYEVAPDARF